MPTIYQTGAFKITMYFQDHMPPHFHILASDGAEALVAIASLEVLAGDVNRRVLADALAWAASNKALLEDTWTRLNP